VIVPDVNVLINAARAGAPDHDLARRTMVDILTGKEPVGLLDETLAATIRILTNPRLGTVQSMADAVSFCDHVRSGPAALRLLPPESAWTTFTASVIDVDLRANDVPDAWLAAVATSANATLVTFDRGFRRFPGLSLHLLGDDTGPRG